jgi:tripartite-type tricarboxylate transporter receptor subunit TctC
MKPGTSPRSSPIWPRSEPADLLFGPAPAGGKPWTRSIALAVLALAMLGMAGRSHAQDHPVRPLTLVVLSRPAAATTSSPGQQIFTDEKGGAGGSVGTRQVVKSPPDGYTPVLAG